VLLVSSVISITNLIQTIYYRIHAEPDYQILTPQSSRFLKSKTPHKKEVFFTIFQTLTQMSYFLEYTLIQHFVVVAYQSEGENLDIHRTARIAEIISLILICFKLTFETIANIRALYQLARQDLYNRADYLNMFWRKA
jgi:hypothetical protein